MWVLPEPVSSYDVVAVWKLPSSSNSWQRLIISDGNTVSVEEKVRAA